jgi:hypothetical protein
MAQGTVNYNIRVSGIVVGHVYGSSGTGPLDSRSGNTTGETPIGTQVYATPVLQGSGFSAQLFSVNLADQAEGGLVAVATSLTTFRTGATLGGTIATSIQTIPNVPIGGTGTFQLRVWDNLGGTVTSWTAAAPLWNNGLGTLAAGKSALFNIANLGDPVTFPADMVNFKSFNLTSSVPEPSTFVLAGLGAAGLLIFRRRK